MKKKKQIKMDRLKLLKEKTALINTVRNIHIFDHKLYFRGFSITEAV